MKAADCGSTRARPARFVVTALGVSAPPHRNQDVRSVTFSKWLEICIDAITCTCTATSDHCGAGATSSGPHDATRVSNALGPDGAAIEGTLSCQ
eukprot:5832290-Prymnesium_polylepis.1